MLPHCAIHREKSSYRTQKIISAEFDIKDLILLNEKRSVILFTALCGRKGILHKERALIIAPAAKIQAYEVTL